MTTMQSPKPGERGAPEVDSDFLAAALSEMRRNEQFFLAQEERLWRNHPGSCLLIYNGSIVEAFDDYPDLLRRRDELSPVARAGALCRWQSDGIWIL